MLSPRLYLSSYRLGDASALLQWRGGGRGRALILMNACDIYPDRLRSWEREAADLDDLGYASSELDLRDHVGRSGELPPLLAEVDLIWVVGGGAFALATLMTATDFGGALRTAWRDGGPIYAGYSAGACVAGPDLQGIDLIDDPDDIPVGYPDVPPTTLGLIPERIVPHWRSDHPGSPGAERAVAELTRRGLAFLTLSDGEVHVLGFGQRDPMGV